MNSPGLAPNLWWLFAGRIIAGLCSATISVPMAYIADATPPEKRAASYGMIHPSRVPPFEEAAA